MLAPAHRARCEPGLGGWKYVAGVAFAVLLYLSVLLHEASHALMAQRYGLPGHARSPCTSSAASPRSRASRDTPGQEFGVSVVGPLTSLAVGVAVLRRSASSMPDGAAATSRSGSLAGANLSSACSTWCPGCRSTAAGCCAPRSGRPPATRTRARSSPAGAAGSARVLALAYPFASAARSSASPPTAEHLPAWPFVIASFLWSGASAVDRVRPGTPPAARRCTPARWPAAPSPCPHDLPAGRGGPPRAGGAGRQHRGARRGRRAVRPSSTRRPCSPPPRTAGPGCRSARSPAPLEPGLTFSADISGEPLILAMQRQPGLGVPPRRRATAASSACWSPRTSTGRSPPASEPADAADRSAPA